ncbi:MAG: 5'/3'-nucleotidase SurE [Candidatus Thorarchaeota archaeon]|nr:5'/3'-nucleotidase SurE [Candidatus Thorarchaeota archaeon]
MHKVCLTNDDGPQSEGLLALAETLSEVVELTVIVPDGQRSATGKALTLNRPLRATEIKSDRYRLITHDGTPADSVVLADWFAKDTQLFISGINAGANVGYQSMLTSGTVGAAMEAALKGFPAIAVSVEASPSEWFNHQGSECEYEQICAIIRDITLKVLEHGMPKNVDVININFPGAITATTQIEIASPTRVRMRNEIVERIDPHGRKYYWLKGIEVEPAPGTDGYALLKNNNIAISPIRISGADEEIIDTLRQFLDL